MHFSSVVFPEPLWPIRPIEEPSAMSNDTSRSAQNSSDRDRDTSSRCLSDVGRSRNSRNILEMPSIRIAVVIAPPRSRRTDGRTSARRGTAARPETASSASRAPVSAGQAHDRQDGDPPRVRAGRPVEGASGTRARSP